MSYAVLLSLHARCVILFYSTWDCFMLIYIICLLMFFYWYALGVEWTLCTHQVKAWDSAWTGHCFIAGQALYVLKDYSQLSNSTYSVADQPGSTGSINTWAQIHEQGLICHLHGFCSACSANRFLHLFQELGYIVFLFLTFHSFIMVVWIISVREQISKYLAMVPSGTGLGNTWFTEHATPETPFILKAH